MQPRAFTLIELLIVIAIILILVAIALPNFLNAQIRARVATAHGEIRSIETAMVSYFLDWEVYPWESENDCSEPGQGRFRCGLAWLTSPIAYMATMPTDPFPPVDGETWYETGIKQIPPDPTIGPAAATWAIWTFGPDNFTSEITSGNADGSVTWKEVGTDGSADQYSPTNGTKSRGDIFLFGGDSYWIGVVGQYARKPGGGIDPMVVNGIPYVHTMPPSYKG
jgi:prepilin-type N-terminal cleavage/methylation domain-containing protein